MGQPVERLAGELELLEYIREYWRYGGSLDQIDSLFSYQMRSEHKKCVSVPQLLEVLVAHGEVLVTDGGAYVPSKPDSVKAAPSKYMYKCLNQETTHQFMLTAPQDWQVKRNIECVVVGCDKLAFVMN